MLISGQALLLSILSSPCFSTYFLTTCVRVPHANGSNFETPLWEPPGGVQQTWKHTHAVISKAHLQAGCAHRSTFSYHVSLCPHACRAKRNCFVGEKRSVRFPRNNNKRALSFCRIAGRQENGSGEPNSAIPGSQYSHGFGGKETTGHVVLSGSRSPENQD